MKSKQFAKYLVILICILMCIMFVACKSSSENASSSESDKQLEEGTKPISNTEKTALDYPKKDIEFILPVPAGGSSDTLARHIVEGLSKETGVTVYITNTPGGALTIGTNEVAKSKPDGYRLLATPLGPIVMQPHYRDLAYKIQDLKPIAYTGARYDVLASKKGKFESFDKLVEYLKTSDNATYGNVAIGGLPHIATENFLLQCDGKAQSVGFEGDADALTALIGGHVDFAIIGGNYQQYYDSGDLDVFAVGSPKRLETMPNIPTFIELGYEIDTAIWEGIYAPADIPDEIAHYLNVTINQVLKSPSVVENLKLMGNVQNPMNLEEFQKFCDEQYAMYEHIINQTEAGKRIKDLMDK